MSFAGLKKQFNKANQYVSEKIGGAEKTKLDEDFVEMERKIDVTCHAVDDLMTKTVEYLQPNPVTRTMTKIRGQNKTAKSLQPVGLLGESMVKNGTDLGENSTFGLAMTDMGESLRQLSEVKDAFDLKVKQNFLDPLDHLKNKDLKEINHHRKKLEGRRLDFDYKKKKQAKASGGSSVPEEEIQMAEEKFAESQELAENGMSNLLDSEVEQVLQLQSLAEAQIEFHRQSTEVLENLLTTLSDRVREAEGKPRTERKTYNSFANRNSGNASDDTDAFSSTTDYNAPVPASSSPKECCKALYDFDAENEGELGFQEGDIINVISKIDENWIEGELNGRSGYFPANYVEIV